MEKLDLILKNKITLLSKQTDILMLSHDKNISMMADIMKTEKSSTSLQYISIYDKNAKLIYTSKNTKIVSKNNGHILKQKFMENNKNKVINILEKVDAKNKVFLIYAIKIQQDNTPIKIIEIAIDISYIQKKLIKDSHHISKDFTFNVSLWNNQIGYNNLLQKKIQIFNYKYIKAFDIKLLIPSLMVLMIILLLINYIYLYLKGHFEKAERRVEDILDTQSSLMIMFTKNRIVRCNKAFLNNLSFKNEEELISLHSHVSDFFVPQDKFIISTIKDTFWADYIMENQENNFYELFLKNKHGQPVDIFDVSTNTYIESENQEKYYIASFRNASARYKNKQDLDLEKIINQKIISNNSDGFVNWNIITGERYISNRIGQILGYNTDEVPSKTKEWMNLINPIHKNIFLQNINICLKDASHMIKHEIQLKDKSGEWVWILIKMQSIAIENNKVIRLILFLTDINDQKKQEQIMKERISKAITENKKQQNLLANQSKLASMGEMIGSIAHQWRQPLNELGIKVQSLKFQYKKGLIDEDFINDFIEQNKTTIMFMSKTIDDFRNFYRTDKTKNDFSILNSINFCLSIQSAELKYKNIKINIDGDDFMHNGFDSEFKQVILNLINNSKDAFEEKDIENRKINILIGNSKIIFTDNAGGIPNNTISRIFEPYFTTKEQGKGTGIGLYMSKSIIENNSGLLYAKNIDNGVCFTIDFRDPLQCH